MISEKHTWYWAALGVTPLTVGKTIPKNWRKRQHRRNDIVLLSSNDYFSGTGRNIATTTNHLTTNSVNATRTTTVTAATMNESMEVELDHHYRCSYLPHNDDVDSDDRYDSHPSWTQPEYTLVFEGDVVHGDDIDLDEIDKLADVRLSLAGLRSQSRALSCSQSSKSSDDRRDELHSNLYSSVLETVRTTLVECIPQVTEEMISRAILHAFASDSNRTEQRNHCHDSSFESDDVMTYYNDKYQDEVNTLYKAYDFMQSRFNQFGKRKKIKDFLQTILDDTFLKIRREEITSSDEVLRTMLSVLSILQIKADTNLVSLPMDTILLQGLPNNTSRLHLQEQLSCFGTIKAIGIAKDNTTFGYCCYMNEVSVKQSITHHDTILIHGVNPTISILHGHNNNAKEMSSVQQQHIPSDGSTDSTINCKRSGRLLWSI